ncbi:hypothetical protein JXC34_05830, partial [Candidatus Woesearchaeota archaeon]|nr:hypothetical protein [Candidatus Woesearchaeota archaeon]
AIFSGFYGMVKASFLKYLMIIRVLLAGLICFLMEFFKGFDFSTYFVLGIFAQNLIGFFVFSVVSPDMFENVTHRISHLAWNAILVRIFMVLIYDLSKLLG